MNPDVNDALQRMLLGCLLYRLGGEQKFTVDELDDIRSMVAGVQISVDDQNSVILRVRNNEFVDHVKANEGLIL